MFEKEIRELFELAWRVANETDYYVKYIISAYVHMVELHVSDKNYVEACYCTGGDFRGPGNIETYEIYYEGFLTESSLEQYKRAKAHLLRLLKKGRCPLNVESDGIEAPANNGADSDSERASDGIE